jgi:hypothetical protein
MKEADNGREAAVLFLTPGMCVTKGSLAIVCSIACNEKVSGKRPGASAAGGAAARGKDS